MIRNIVFDLGQVLFKFTPKNYLDRNFSSDRVDLLYREVFREKEWSDLSRGVITSEEAAKSISSRGFLSYEESKQILEDRKKIVTPIESNFKIVSNLIENGYRVFLLADFHKDLFNDFLEEIPILQQVHGKVISSEVNMLKFEKEIYSYFLKKYQLNPKETFLIDDSKHNIQNAHCFGIKGLVLKKPEDLQNELEELEML